MAIDITIGGTSYLAGSTEGKWVTSFEDVSIDLDIALQQPDATFVVYVWNQSIERPRAMSEIIMTNDSDDPAQNREFGGIVLQVQEEEIDAQLMKYTVSCGDYTKWLDRHLVATQYGDTANPADPGITADYVLKQIVQTYVNTQDNYKAFTTNGVMAAPAVPSIQFVYQPPSECIAQLAQMTGYGYYIDSYRDIKFYPKTNFLSPLKNWSGNNLNLDDLFDNPAISPTQIPLWIDCVLSEDVSQLKNRVFITGIQIATQSLYTDNMIGNGLQTVYTMAYQAPFNVDRVTVTVGGQTYQIGLDLIDSDPTQDDCEDNVAYVNFTAQTIRFCSPPGDGVPVVVTYYPMITTTVQQDDIDSQAYFKTLTDTDGVFSFNRMDPALTAELPTLANERAYITLQKYSRPYYSCKFTSYVQGWLPGQYFNLQSQRRMGGELNDMLFYVTHVNKTLVSAIDGVLMWKFGITAASIPYEI